MRNLPVIFAASAIVGIQATGALAASTGYRSKTTVESFEFSPCGIFGDHRADDAVEGFHGAKGAGQIARPTKINYRGPPR